MKRVKVGTLKINPNDYPDKWGSMQRVPHSGAFDELVELVKERGVLVPVRIHNRIVVEGQYRYWAACAAKLESVPVVEV